MSHAAPMMLVLTRFIIFMKLIKKCIAVSCVDVILGFVFLLFILFFLILFWFCFGNWISVDMHLFSCWILWIANAVEGKYHIGYQVNRWEEGNIFLIIILNCLLISRKQMGLSKRYSVFVRGWSCFGFNVKLGYFRHLITDLLCEI